MQTQMQIWIQPFSASSLTRPLLPNVKMIQLHAVKISSGTFLNFSWKSQTVFALFLHRKIGHLQPACVLTFIVGSSSSVVVVVVAVEVWW